MHPTTSQSCCICNRKSSKTACYSGEAIVRVDYCAPTGFRYISAMSQSCCRRFSRTVCCSDEETVRVDYCVPTIFGRIYFCHESILLVGGSPGPTCCSGEEMVRVDYCVSDCFRGFSKAACCRDEEIVRVNYCAPTAFGYIFRSRVSPVGGYPGPRAAQTERR